MIKELDHSRIYYKGLGNCDYSECLDRIAEDKKSIIQLIVLSAGCFLFCSLCNMYYPQKMDGVLFLTGLYLGMCQLVLYICINDLKKFKLRLKEIKGE